MTVLDRESVPPVLEIVDPTDQDVDHAERVELPVLPLRAESLYPIPDSMTPFLVGREGSVSAIEDALARDRRILAVAQRQPTKEDVAFDDLHEVGTEAQIIRMLRLPDGTTSVLVHGVRRVRVVSVVSEYPIVRVVGQVVDDLDEDPAISRAAMPRVLKLFQRVARLSDAIPEEALIRAMNAETPGLLADAVAASLNLSLDDHQTLLEMRDVAERLQRVRTLLDEEIQVLKLEQEIRESTRNDVDIKQREFYLREQMRAIIKEIGETNSQNAEVAAIRERLESSAFPDLVAKRGLKELDRLNALPHGSPETSVLRTYLEWLTELPWRRRSKDMDGRGARGSDPQPIPPWAEGCERAPAGVHRGAPSRATLTQPDPLFRGTARRRKDEPRSFDRRGAGPQLRASVPGRCAGRGRDSRPPDDVCGLHAGPHSAENAGSGDHQSRLHDRRDRQAWAGLPRRPRRRPARSARPRAESHLQRPLSRVALRSEQGDVHCDRQHAARPAARAGRPHGGDRAAGLRGGREGGNRGAVPGIPAAA